LCWRTLKRAGCAWRRSVAHGHDIATQPVELGIICLAARANGNVGRPVTERWQEFDSSELTQPTLESIAVDRGVLMTRHDDPDTRKTERGSEDSDIEIRGPNSLPLSNDVLYVRAPRQSMLARETKTIVRRQRTCLAA
jgi:hypothetical protein